MPLKEMKSLEALCLDSIFYNLDGFCAVYNSDKSDVNRDRFVHLQTMYTETIIARTRGKFRLKNKHVKLLINKYVKRLDMEDFSNCSWKVVKKRLLQCGGAYNELKFIRYFCNCRHRDTQCETWWEYKYTIYPWRNKPMEYGLFSEVGSSPHLCHPNYFYLPPHEKFSNYCCSKNKISKRSFKQVIYSSSKNIQILSFTAASVTDNMLKVIAKNCPQLHTLTVSHCRKITDKGLKNLFSINKTEVIPRCSLKCLDVSSTGVKDAGIKFVLKHMPSMKMLTHQRTAIVLYEMHKTDLDNNDLEKLQKYNLVALDIYMEIFEYKVLQVCSSLCTSLKRLDISYSTKPDFWFREMKVTTSMPSPETISSLCCKFNYLCSLRLCGNYKISIDSFLQQKGNQLIELDLMYFKLCLRDITQTCPNLDSLSLYSIQFTNSKLVDFSPMEKLKTFGLYTAHFLGYSMTSLMAAFLTEACPNLDILRLTYCHSLNAVIEGSVLNIANRLKELDLRYSELQPAFLESVIACCPKLKTLDIRDCKKPEGWIDDILAILQFRQSSINLLWGYYHGIDCHRLYHPVTHINLL